MFIEFFRHFILTNPRQYAALSSANMVYALVDFVQTENKQISQVLFAIFVIATKSLEIRKILETPGSGKS